MLIERLQQKRHTVKLGDITFGEAFEFAHEGATMVKVQLNTVTAGRVSYASLASGGVWEASANEIVFPLKVRVIVEAL